MKRSFFILILGVLAASSAVSTSRDSGNRVPVLLELFTSEGCSSCPPADRLLETLDQNQPVAGANAIVLSEHVDYWDNGGWTDPFSSAEFTSRQKEYGRQFGLDGVYTPQLVVDGQAQLVGSNDTQARDAIGQAARRPKTPVDIVLVDQHAAKLSVRVGVSSVGGRDAKVFVALAEKHADSQVGRGENSGRHLRHVAVVRSLVMAGTAKAGTAFSQQVSLIIPPGAGKGGLRIVAFVQERASGRVLGATQLEF